MMNKDMNTPKEVLLKVEHLEQFFKMGPNTLKAVNDVSFDIYKGEVFGLVGESGCGKTTTGRSIIRLYNITGGSVYFNGVRICAGTRRYKARIKELKEECKEKIKYTLNEEEVLNITNEYKALIQEQKALLRAAKTDHKYCNKEYASSRVQLVKDKYIGQDLSNPEINQEYKHELKIASKDTITSKIQMIFQDPISSLNPRMTVREIISEGLIIRGWKDKEKINREVYRVLEMVGLVPEHAGRYPHEFSGGQRQRIGIARAIVLNPEFIIADEPISALDVSIQAQVINLLNEIRQRLGLTILFIAHDLSVVKYFSDRIAVMYFGKIVELSTSEEIFKHPLHPYTKSLFSAIPLPDPRSEKKRKRVTYNPLVAHDYTQQGPSMREVAPGHFVYCNDAEFNAYVEELKK